MIRANLLRLRKATLAGLKWDSIEGKAHGCSFTGGVACCIGFHEAALLKAFDCNVNTLDLLLRCLWRKRMIN